MSRADKTQSAAYMAGGLLLLAGAAAYPSGWLYAFHIYAAGACAFAYAQFSARYEGDNLVVRRLRRQQVLGALLLLCTAGFMAMRTFNFGFAREQEWLVCLAVACVLELYTAFRIPAELEKEKRSKPGGRQRDDLG